ncbi:MAG: hypothetical protein RR846_07340 [Oscillospiraceae bacterium]
MKKLISMVLVLALATAIALPAFAATPSNCSRADLQAKLSKYSNSLSNAQVEAVKTAINNLTEQEAKMIDVGELSAIAKPLKAKLENGQLTPADITGAETNVKNALNGAATVSLTNVTVNGKYVKATVNVTTKSGVASSSTLELVPITPEANGNGAEAGTTAAVIKNTGAQADTTGVIVMAMSIVTILGVGAVAARKLGLAE